MAASVGVLSGPVAAQTAVWSATLTLKQSNNNVGCDNTVSGSECSGALTLDSFTFDGATYTINGILQSAKVIFALVQAIPDAMLESGWELRIGSTSFPLESADTSLAYIGLIDWPRPDGFSLSVGEEVAVSLGPPETGGGAAPFGVVPHVVVPLAPDSPRLEAGPGSLAVSWEPSAARAGGVLEACWVLRYSDDGGRNWTTVPHHSTTTTATLDGLAGGRRHLVRVAALVGGLTGFWSPPTEATPATAPPSPPQAPQTLTVDAGRGELAVSWGAPPGDGGAPLSGYLSSTPPTGTPGHRPPTPAPPGPRSSAASPTASPASCASRRSTPPESARGHRSRSASPPI